MPKITFGYRPDDFKSEWKAEELCQEGLTEGNRMHLYENSYNIKLTSWVDRPHIYLEEIGLDIVFRVYDNTQGKGVYLLDNWGLMWNKLKIDKWIESSKTGLTYPEQGKSPVWFFDQNNLRWYGKAIINSIVMYLWESLEKYLLYEPSGSEVFTAVVSKLQFIK